jgi:hypothetical protein
VLSLAEHRVNLLILIVFQERKALIKILNDKDISALKGKD